MVDSGSTDTKAGKGGTETATSKPAEAIETANSGAAEAVEPGFSVGEVGVSRTGRD